MNIGYLVIFYLNIAHVWLTERYIFKTGHNSHLQTARKLGCKYLSKIDDKHVCESKTNSYSTKHLSSLANSYVGIHMAYKDGKGIRETRELLFNDPDIGEQWYLNDHGSRYNKRISHNVQKVWDMGINGSGVVSAIVDDGIFRGHIDLEQNFNQFASYNFVETNDNPHTSIEHHGTRCAGLIAALANNNICGVGVAFGSSVGAIRVLSSSKSLVFDSAEALSVSFKREYIDIYSMSWGPTDDGLTLDGPRELTKKAFRRGVREGRRGLGNIYFFSSGNGGRSLDTCGFDGYLQQPEIFVIGSMTEEGRLPPYAEKCSAVLASTVSSKNNHPGNKIYTTDIDNTCGKVHSGTSVSAPLAAGMIALLLHANPNLTYRDVFHLIVVTSIQYDQLAVMNSAGYYYSSNFGFGLINIYDMVRMSQTSVFTPLSPLHICHTHKFISTKKVMNGGIISAYLYSSGCLAQPYCSSTIENVLLTFTLRATFRNGINMYLTSPSGTKIPIIQSRAYDTSSEGFFNWTVKVVGFYGESPVGIWLIEVRVDNDIAASLDGFSMSIYGNGCTLTEKSKAIHEAIRYEVCDNVNKDKTSSVIYARFCQSPTVDLLVNIDEGIDQYSLSEIEHQKIVSIYYLENYYSSWLFFIFVIFTLLLPVLCVYGGKRLYRKIYWSKEKYIRFNSNIE